MTMTTPVSARPNHPRLTPHISQRMALAKHPPRNLKVVIRKHHMTIKAREASWMKLLIHVSGGPRTHRLKVLALDAAVAALAQRAVLLVVVVLAEGVVVDDVEVCGREGLRAGAADEAGFVPAAGQAAVGGFDGFAFDAHVAAAADCSAGGWAAGELGARRSLGNGRGLEGSWSVLVDW